METIIRNNWHLWIDKKSESAVKRLEDGRPLVLDDAGSVWIVLAGHADLFSVPIQSGQISGKRRFMFRATEDEWLLGFQLAPNEPGVGIMVTGTTETLLLRLDKTSVGDKIRNDPVCAGQAARGIEGWKARLSNAIVADSVRLKHGSTCDKVPLPLDPSTSLFDAGFEWHAIDRFHLQFDACMMRLRFLIEQEEREQLQNKTENERLQEESAFALIASALKNPRTSQLQPSGAVRHPVYLACQQIGIAEGIDFVAPAALRRRESVADSVAEIARASRVRARRILLQGEWWKQDGGSLLAFIKDKDESKPVAVICETAGRFSLHDPASGQRVRVGPSEAALIEPEAYSFYRSFPGKEMGVLDLLRFGVGSGIKRDIGRALLVGIACGLLGTFIPAATGWLFQSIIPEADRGQLVHLTAVLIVSSLSVFLFELTRSAAMLRIDGKLDNSIQAAVWDRLLSLPVSFFRSYTAGDLALRANNINAILRQFSVVTLSAIFSGIFSLFSFALLFYYDAGLAMTATVLVLISVAATCAAGLLKVRRLRTVEQLQGSITGLVLQWFNGIATLKVFHSENRVFHQWAEKYVQLSRLKFSSRMIEIGHTVFHSSFPIICSMVLYFTLVSKGASLSAGKFLGFLAAFTSFMTAMISMSKALLASLEIIPLYERTRPILQAKPEFDESKADPGTLSGDIEVSHVSFRYNADELPILRDVTLRIRPGEFVAIVGPSGSGKSTLMRLILGFDAPESGSIFFDGQDMSGLDIRLLRSQAGVVLQDGQLMAGNIFDNIVGSANVTLAAAWEAAAMAGLDRDIREMPMGMYTVISEGSSTISGGQRQRILIARAIVKQPRILFFDEATSALDNQTQAVVGESLKKLNATKLVIAHRLSTIVNADRIYVMDKGEIVQSGTYAELICQEGLFADLAARQQLS